MNSDEQPGLDSRPESGAGNSPVSEPLVDSGERLPVAEQATAVEETAASEPPPAATIRLWHKHPLATRWMHWINFPLLAVMIWSGILIYWADSDGNGDHASQVYRIGVGHWTLFRFFPMPFYQRLHLTFGLAKGMGYHYFFMWFFAINGILYALYTLISGEWRTLAPRRGALRNAWLVTLHDLHLIRTKPPQGKYNGGQQIAYTAIVLMGFGSLLTGLAIYKPVQMHVLTTLLGGYEMARWFHFWLTMGFVAFFVIHVVQVIHAGWNNFRSMVSGYEIALVQPEDEMQHE